jgi:hypothetical protein
VIALSVVSIVKDAERQDGSVPAPSAVVAPIPPLPPPPAPSAIASPAPSAVPALELADASAADFYEATDDGEPTEPKNTPPKPPKRYGSVQQAAQESCSTASVEKLSRQIIDQARCLKPNAFVPLPARANLVVAPNVFPYLELGARNQLLRVLDANPSRRMTLNSALRTVAQQYLVSRWAAGKRCGVPLATRPGESNHEIGTALDVAEPAQWRSALEAHDFRWLGASDRVHFDYKGSAAPPASTTDVLAFQILWNKNHPTDTLTADGRYTPATEQRLKKAPAEGFPIGPRCGKARTR